jgi:hypothetical protein
LIVDQLKFFRPPPARVDHQRVTSIEAGPAFGHLSTSEAGSIQQADEPWSNAAESIPYQSDVPTGLVAPLETLDRGRGQDTTEFVFNRGEDTAQRESLVDPAKDSPRNRNRTGRRQGRAEVDLARSRRLIWQEVRPSLPEETTLLSPSPQPLSSPVGPTARPRPMPLQMPDAGRTWAASSFAEFIFAESDEEADRAMDVSASGPSPPPEPTPLTSWHGSPASSRSRHAASVEGSENSDYGDDTFGPRPRLGPSSRDDSPFLDCGTTPRSASFQPPVGMPSIRSPSEKDPEEGSYADHESFIEFDDPNLPDSPAHSDSVGPLRSAGLDGWHQQSASYRRSLLSVEGSSMTSPGGHRVSSSSPGGGGGGNVGGARGGRASLRRSSVSVASSFSAISDFPEPPSHLLSWHEVGHTRTRSLPSPGLNQAAYHSTETDTSTYPFASNTQDGGRSDSRVSVPLPLPQPGMPAFDRSSPLAGPSTADATSPPLPTPVPAPLRWSVGPVGREFMELLRRRSFHQTHARTSSDPHTYSS